MGKSVAIIGAGILGLLLAEELRAKAWRVSLFERLPWDGRMHATSYAAGGMLAPFSELESAEAQIALWGCAALELWPQLLERLPRRPYFRQSGSLLLSHARDWPYYEQLLDRIRSQAPRSAYELRAVAELESEVAERFSEGFYLPQEAHLDNREVMHTLLAHLKEQDIDLRFNQSVVSMDGGSVRTREGARETFDLVCDCRGIEAQGDLLDLRGVRGEALIVHAPSVRIGRPLRLMHPRYAVYIVPRADSHYYIGASSIESSSRTPITVRSSLELLSAAYSVHKGFGEASIVELLQGVRPAYPHNRPEVSVAGRLLRANGLYRHGFLLSPYLVRQISRSLEGKDYDSALFKFL